MVTWKRNMTEEQDLKYAIYRMRRLGYPSYPVYRTIVAAFRFNDWLEHVAYDRKARKPRQVWYTLECGHTETRSIAVNPTTQIQCSYCRYGIITKGSLLASSVNGRKHYQFPKKT